jgi:hypothetical protein
MDGSYAPQIGNFNRCHEALDLEDVGWANVLPPEGRSELLEQLAEDLG